MAQSELTDLSSNGGDRFLAQFLECFGSTNKTNDGSFRIILLAQFLCKLKINSGVPGWVG